MQNQYAHLPTSSEHPSKIGDGTGCTPRKEEDTVSLVRKAAFALVINTFALERTILLYIA
jgi:hypothetical protein